MEPTLVPRTAWYGDKPPCNNDGVTIRPRLRKPVLGGLAVHYTGSFIRVRNSTDDAVTYMRWMQDSAFRQKKSFEYNDIIPPRADRSSQVWEYAGDYMAAHAGAINNPSWYAIQFALGVNNHPSQSGYDRLKPTIWQPLTDEMVNAFRWRRHDLVQRGLLAPDHEVRPHRELPTAATACCGDGILSRWDDLLEPWVESLPPTPQPLPPEDDMKPFLWRDARFANVFLVESANAITVDEVTRNRAQAEGVKLYVGEHDQFLKSCVVKAGLNWSDLVAAA